MTSASSRDVRFLRRFVTRAAKLLDVKTSSARVARSFDILLADVQAAINRYPDSARAEALKRMKKTSEIFGEKIFTCYDHPEIPATDNELEGSFRDTRRHERLITGHKSTARRTVRDGPFTLPALQRARQALPSVEELSRVPEETWRSNLDLIRQARARHDRPRHLRANLKTSLKDIVKRCHELPRVRDP